MKALRDSVIPLNLNYKPQPCISRTPKFGVNYTGKILVPVDKPHRYIAAVVRSISATGMLSVRRYFYSKRREQVSHVSPTQVIMLRRAARVACRGRVTSAADNPVMERPVDGCRRRRFVTFTEL